MLEFVHVLQSWSLIDGQTIAIDSFKIRAQNSLKNNFNQKKIDRQIDYIDKKIAEYENTLIENDSLDSLQNDEIKSKIKYNQEKKQNYKNIESELKDLGQTQISKKV